MWKLKVSVLLIVIAGAILGLPFSKSVASVVSPSNSSTKKMFISQDLPDGLIKVSPDNLEYEVMLGGEHNVILPSGTIIEPTGIITTSEGLKFQFVIVNGKLAGIQLYRANGDKLLPEETLTLPNGQTLKQPKF